MDISYWVTVLIGVYFCMTGGAMKGNVLDDWVYR